MRKMMFAFFRQMFGMPDPAARLAGAGRLVVAQFSVQCFDKLDSFPQRSAQVFGCIVFKIPEVLQTVFPATVLARIAVVTAFASCFEKVLVFEITPFDHLPNQQLGKSERFYELSSHGFLLDSMI
jgi:hypothetical protein